MRHEIIVEGRKAEKKQLYQALKMVKYLPDFKVFR